MHDETADPTRAYLYEAYGKVYSDLSEFYELSDNGYDATYDSPILYAGQYYDAESGMYYLRARYYSPDLKRFICEDPIRDGMNWYAYCAGNPVRYIDPSGKYYAEQAISWAPNISNFDGSLPFGELLALIIIFGAVCIDGVVYGISQISTAWRAYQKSEQNEGSANGKEAGYEDAKENGERAPRANDENEKSSLPATGEPNSSTDLYDENGELKQRRYYGPDGKAEKI